MGEVDGLTRCQPLSAGRQLLVDSDLGEGGAVNLVLFWVVRHFEFRFL